MTAFGAIVDWTAKPVSRHEIGAMTACVPHRGARTFGPLMLTGPRACVAIGLRCDAPDTCDGAACWGQDDARRCAVVADAVIYNRAHLARTLGLAADATTSDVLLAAYAKWREGLFDRLDGDFAIVIWDGERNTVIAGRDPFGVRTLYFCVSGRRFFVASEVKQIILAGAAEAEPDPVRLAEFLIDRGNDLERSFFRNVARVKPGHTLIVHPQASRQERYWEPPLCPTANCGTTRAERFRALLKSAVAKRMVPAGPTLIELSGGHDSSSIAALAYEIASAHSASFDIAAISYTYPGLSADETTYIRELLRVRPLKWIPIPCKTSGYEDLWETAMWRTDSPFADLQRPMRAQAEERAHACGARVLLSGFCGDEVLEDEGALADLFWSGHFLSLMPEQGSWMEVARQVTPNALKFAYRKMRGRPSQEWPDWASANLGTLLPSPHPAPSGLSHVQAHLWRWLALHSRVSWATGWYASGTSGLDLEPRFPFLDRDLFSYLFNLRAAERVPLRPRKQPLRGAMRNDWPAIILERTDKTDFGSYYTRVLKNAWPALRGRVFERNSRMELLGVLLDSERSEALLRGWEADPNPSYAITYPVWRIVCIKLWLSSLSRYSEERARIAAGKAEC